MRSSGPSSQINGSSYLLQNKNNEDETSRLHYLNVAMFSQSAIGFAGLIGHGAARLTGGLTGCLAFAASFPGTRHLYTSLVNDIDVLHVNFLPKMNNK